MKRTSMVSAVLATAIAVSVPMLAWSYVNPNVPENPDIADAVMPNHHYGGPHRSGQGGHGGCW